MPILIADLFPEVRREMLQVLKDLSPAELLLGCDAEPTASIGLPQDAARRMFTKGLPADEAKRLAAVGGRPELSEPFFRTIAVIA